MIIWDNVELYTHEICVKETCNMIPLSQRLLFLLRSFQTCFKRENTFIFLLRFFYGLIMIVIFKKTITQVFLANEGKRGLSGFYNFLHRHKWESLDLSKEILRLVEKKTSNLVDESSLCRRFTVIGLDPSYTEKSGKKIDGGASFHDHSSNPNSPRYNSKTTS